MNLFSIPKAMALIVFIADFALGIDGLQVNIGIFNSDFALNAGNCIHVERRPGALLLFVARVVHLQDLGLFGLFEMLLVD